MSVVFPAKQILDPTLADYLLPSAKVGNSVRSEIRRHSPFGATQRSLIGVQ
jgi:hypothetical protein